MTGVRRAGVEDAAEIARLSGELGYPADAATMGGRIAAASRLDHHYLAVAVAPDGHLLGWIHAEHELSVEYGERVELKGLFVDGRARRSGAGRLLVEAAERWAAGREVGSMLVRSNAARDASHPFYEALGYARIKTQHVYVKALAAEARRA
jgi:GNAT superfamily N-acetyltransferase